jgi:hypothetical protein
LYIAPNKGLSFLVVVVKSLQSELGEKVDLGFVVFEGALDDVEGFLLTLIDLV